MLESQWKMCLQWLVTLFHCQVKHGYKLEDCSKLVNWQQWMHVYQNVRDECCCRVHLQTVCLQPFGSNVSWVQSLQPPPFSLDWAAVDNMWQHLVFATRARRLLPGPTFVRMRSGLGRLGDVCWVSVCPEGPVWWQVISGRKEHVVI